MASAKIAMLFIRTLAKPISNSLKAQAKEHESFRKLCVGLAQRMYRSEVRLRNGLLGEPAKHIRPLSEAKAVDTGANALAEGFLFTVAAGLIIGETWRSSRSQSRRRDDVDEKLETLTEQVEDMTARMESLKSSLEQQLSSAIQRNDELSRILERVVEIGLRGGWAEFQDSPLQVPLISLNPQKNMSFDTQEPPHEDIFPSEDPKPKDGPPKDKS